MTDDEALHAYIERVTHDGCMINPYEFLWETLTEDDVDDSELLSLAEEGLAITGEKLVIEAGQNLSSRLAGPAVTALQHRLAACISDEISTSIVDVGDEVTTADALRKKGVEHVLTNDGVDTYFNPYNEELEFYQRLDDPFSELLADVTSHHDPDPLSESWLSSRLSRED